MSESQAFTEYNWAPPEAIKPMRGDEHCWKLGCENLNVFTVRTLTSKQASNTAATSSVHKYWT